MITVYQSPSLPRKRRALLRKWSPDIGEFRKKTGCSVVINTSFNVRGEPIVCTPEDAIRCFLGTEMDVLVLEDFILKKADQPESLKTNKDSYLDQFALD